MGRLKGKLFYQLHSHDLKYFPKGVRRGYLDILGLAAQGKYS